jgi:hypothetical protein
MDVTAVASMASDMIGQNIGQQFGVAILKSIQDQQKQQGAALIQMIQQTASAIRPDGHVDVYA